MRGSEVLLLRVGGLEIIGQSNIVPKSALPCLYQLGVV